MSGVVLLSGGLDSTVLSAKLADDLGRVNVDAVSIDYGQGHRRELDAAAEVAKHLGIRHDVVDLSGLGKLLRSALTTEGLAVPHGHYAADNMAATVVPNRNAILLMIAVGVAASRGHWYVATAVHAGDHPVYPDCRPEFIEAASAAATAGTAGMGDVKIMAPFSDMSKADIVAAGAAIKAPLSATWSCYGRGRLHCGRCGTCVERAEAFDLAGVSDPTEYADPAYWRDAVSVR